MPWIDPKDETPQRAIERWKIDAIDAVDDIGNWRSNPTERNWHDKWRELRNFSPNTSYLCAWLRTQHPSLDPKPLEQICLAVRAWHEDHDADRVPPQAELEAL